jgi:hypothetical protein
MRYRHTFHHNIKLSVVLDWIVRKINDNKSLFLYHQKNINILWFILNFKTETKLFSQLLNITSKYEE